MHIKEISTRCFTKASSNALSNTPPGSHKKCRRFVSLIILSLSPYLLRRVTLYEGSSGGFGIAKVWFDSDLNPRGLKEEGFERRGLLVALAVQGITGISPVRSSRKLREFFAKAINILCIDYIPISNLFCRKLINKMVVPDFSLDYLADTLINRLDRKKIFPPQLNDPENLLSTSYNRMTPPTRPPNGFLLCRKNVHHEAKRQGQCNMRVISKVTGILWRNATAEEKEIYEELANQVSFVYAQRYHGDPQKPPQPTAPNSCILYYPIPHTNCMDEAYSSSYSNCYHHVPTDLPETMYDHVYHQLQFSYLTQNGL
ncbi:1398_t:CDS:2 [Acaulospora morrowiae]|uniref:1398_t:CDS:1 n=1 Tax=Acaulospora morrowiae TaxID=94023 RepID=A0A9N9EMB1_9GLOM|nr:1398_t:CDS:2 [Acaulospora morrowiae]